MDVVDGQVTAKTFKILIGCTGSVASVKVPRLVQHLFETVPKNHSVQVQVVATDKALCFFAKSDVQDLAEIKTDASEWNSWTKIGDSILHIELRRWADIMVIAPLDANTLAKVACGLCDNLLTCVVRAWDPTKPLLFCPAMNTVMWEHPITARHISTLKSDFGYIEVPCVSKSLACGDCGLGAMAEVKDIVTAIWNHLVNN